MLQKLLSMTFYTKSSISIIAIIAIISSLMTSCQSIVKQSPQNHPSTTIESADGIDVSHYQRSINWKVTKESLPNCKFVYVKCTEGATYQDPKYKQNAKDAR